MNGKFQTIDWGAFGLAALAVVAALAGAFMFGSRHVQFHAVIVAIVLLLGTAGVFLIKKSS